MNRPLRGTPVDIVVEAPGQPLSAAAGTVVNSSNDAVVVKVPGMTPLRFNLNPANKTGWWILTDGSSRITVFPTGHFVPAFARLVSAHAKGRERAMLRLPTLDPEEQNRVTQALDNFDAALAGFSCSPADTRSEVDIKCAALAAAADQVDTAIAHAWPDGL